MKYLALIGKLFLWLAAAAFAGLAVFYLYENRTPGYKALTAAELIDSAAALDKNGKPPVEYVTEQFKNHSVVILGEPHRVKQHYEFLISLVRPLQKAGVTDIGIEFFLESDQQKLDLLLSGAKFDTKAAREIILAPNILFYYQELFDFLKAVWTANRFSRHIRVLGLGRYNVYGKSRDTDRKMAEIVAGEERKGHKILVYCGAHHAFTSYTQPFPLRSPRSTPRRRMGNYLKDYFKTDPFFINLHHPVAKRFWFFVPIGLYRQGFCLPFGGTLDQIFRQRDKPIGFDCGLPQFRGVTDSFSYYASGYGSILLKNYCDGYVYLNPVAKNGFVTPLAGIAATQTERDYIVSKVGKDLGRFFVTQESALRLLKHDGITPEEMNKRLDLRGLKGEF